MNLSHLWLSQFDPSVPGAGPAACYRACREMARRGFGVVFPESTVNHIRLADAELDHGAIQPNVSGFEKAKAMMLPRLMIGVPVIVGEHYKMGSQNRDHATDHFVLLCGVMPSGILVGLNPGAEMHGGDFNAAFMEDTAAHVFRTVAPVGLVASMSMVVLA